MDHGGLDYTQSCRWKPLLQEERKLTQKQSNSSKKSCDLLLLHHHNLHLNWLGQVSPNFSGMTVRVSSFKIISWDLIGHQRWLFYRKGVMNWKKFSEPYSCFLPILIEWSFFEFLSKSYSVTSLANQVATTTKL